MCIDTQFLAEILLDIAGQESQSTLDDAATALMMETQNPISQARLPSILSNSLLEFPLIYTQGLVPDWAQYISCYQHGTPTFCKESSFN